MKPDTLRVERFELNWILLFTNRRQSNWAKSSRVDDWGLMFKLTPGLLFEHSYKNYLEPFIKYHLHNLFKSVCLVLNMRPLGLYLNLTPEISIQVKGLAVCSVEDGRNFCPFCFYFPRIFFVFKGVQKEDGYFRERLLSSLPIWFLLLFIYPQ